MPEITCSIFLKSTSADAFFARFVMLVATNSSPSTPYIDKLVVNIEIPICLKEEDNRLENFKSNVACLLLYHKELLVIRKRLQRC